MKKVWESIPSTLHSWGGNFPRWQLSKTGICPPWKLGLRSKNFWKTWNQLFNSD